MRNRDIILKSCDEAEKYLGPHADNDHELSAIEAFINTFRCAAGANAPKFPLVSVEEAVRDTFLYTSTDLGWHLQVKKPVIWNSLMALRPAAGQLQDFGRFRSYQL